MMLTFYPTNSFYNNHYHPVIFIIPQCFRACRRHLNSCIIPRAMPLCLWWAIIIIITSKISSLSQLTTRFHKCCPARRRFMYPENVGSAGSAEVQKCRTNTQAIHSSRVYYFEFKMFFYLKYI
jgi:hypothetical protein